MSRRDGWWAPCCSRRVHRKSSIGFCRRAQICFVPSRRTRRPPSSSRCLSLWVCPRGSPRSPWDNPSHKMFDLCDNNFNLKWIRMTSNKVRELPSKRSIILTHFGAGMSHRFHLLRIQSISLPHPGRLLWHS